MSPVSTSSDGTGVVAFQSKTVGCFGVVSERTGLLPYQEWHVRPTAGQFGAEAIVAIQTSRAAANFQVVQTAAFWLLLRVCLHPETSSHVVCVIDA